jgi:putative membrane protein
MPGAAVVGAGAVDGGRGVERGGVRGGADVTGGAAVVVEGGEVLADEVLADDVLADDVLVADGDDAEGSRRASLRNSTTTGSAVATTTIPAAIAQRPARAEGGFIRLTSPDVRPVHRRGRVGDIGGGHRTAGPSARESGTNVPRDTPVVPFTPAAVRRTLHRKGSDVAMMWWNDGPGTGGWLVMSLIMVAFWGLLVVAGVLAWRGIDRGGRRGSGKSTAQQVLDERFARGEIDEDDYRHRDELLRSGH